MNTPPLHLSTITLWNKNHKNLILTSNCLSQGALVKVKLERPNFINVAVESMDSIFKNPSSIFTILSAMEFIDNGIEIDCNQTAFAAKAACAEMRRSKLLKIMNAEKTRLRFRWFDRVWQCYKFN